MLIDGSRMAITGLASGLDTARVVDQLMAVESRPLDRLGWDQALWTERRTRWTAIGEDAGRLLAASRALAEPASWDDVDGAVRVVRDWIDAYGAIAARLADQLDDDRASRPRTKAEYLAGPLASDGRVFELLDQLRRIAQPLQGAIQASDGSSIDVGIEGSAAIHGAASPLSATLVLDEATLRAALEAAPAEVEALFADGLAPAARRLVDGWRHGGVVDTALDGAGRVLAHLQVRADELTDRLDQRRRTLEQMFERMESMLTRLRSQGDALSTALSGLPRSAA